MNPSSASVFSTPARPLPGVLVGRLGDPLPAGTPAFLPAALAWLRENAAAAAPGRNDIGEGGCAFANADEYAPHAPDPALFEVHRRYADVQFVLEGEEDVLLLPSEGLAVAKPFDEAKDIAFLRADPAAARVVRLRAGDWMLIEPGVAHEPGVAPAGGAAPGRVRKRIVKAEASR